MGRDNNERLATVTDGYGLYDILCSYSQWIFYPGPYSLLLQMIQNGQMRLFRHTYDFNSIPKEEINKKLRFYKNFLRIRGVRWPLWDDQLLPSVWAGAFALCAKEHMGGPSYKSCFVYYGRADTVVECADLIPEDLLRLFVRIPGLKAFRLYLRPKKGDALNVYYSFEPTEKGRETIKKFRQGCLDEKIRPLPPSMVWDRMVWETDD